MRIKVNFFVGLLLTLFMALPLITQAQFDDPDPPPPSNTIPFDAGLSLVIGAGIAYAAKRKHDMNKKSKK